MAHGSTALKRSFSCSMSCLNASRSWIARNQDFNQFTGIVFEKEISDKKKRMSIKYVKYRDKMEIFLVNKQVSLFRVGWYLLRYFRTEIQAGEISQSWEKVPVMTAKREKYKTTYEIVKMRYFCYTAAFWRKTWPCCNVWSVFSSILNPSL